MQSPDQLRPKRWGDERFRMSEKKEQDWIFNRDLYLAVGDPWQWIDKKSWTDEQWKDYVSAPALRTFGACYDDKLAGYFELLGDAAGGIEIAYFGLLPDFFGRGLGGALLTNAIEEAWHTNPTPARVWVHTCTRDHPSALSNYQARGFAIYKITEE